MKTYLSAVLYCSTIFVGLNCLSQQSESVATFVTNQAIALALGSWEGSLTYKDYSSGEPFTMPANVEVGKGKKDNVLMLQNIFPNEPKANSTGRIKLSKKGRRINKNTVISKEVLSDGTVQITASNTGKDNGKKAEIRLLYSIAKDELIISKEVKFEGAGSWLQRNEFRYQRSDKQSP